MEKETGDKMKVCLKTSSKRIFKFAVANKLDGNDKESVSLMLLYPAQRLFVLYLKTEF